MRRGTDNNFLYNKNEELMGINLGADFVSEHEWGIKKIQHAFNINFISEKPKKSIMQKLKKVIANNENEVLFGIEKRRIQKVSDYLVFFEQKNKKQKEEVLIFSPYYHEAMKNSKVLLPKELYISEKTGLGTAWSEGDFGIVTTEENKTKLLTIYQAFQEKDIAITLGGGHVFQNGGLMLLIISKLDEEIKKEMHENDVDRFNLEKASKETGIHQLLKEAGKNYYALSPRWKDETKTEVVFWLNPMEQNRYNYGLYSIEELKQWAHNEGPILMDKKNISK